MDTKKILEKIVPNTVSSIATWIIIILLTSLGTSVGMSIRQAKQVKENTKTGNYLVKSVKILGQNDSIIIRRLDEKVDYSEYELGIEVYQNVQDSSLLVLNNMNLTNVLFYQKIVELFEQQKYYNRELLKYAKENAK